MTKPLIIAIDGPAASGKGSLGRRVAAHFGLEYLDTGKLYRFVGLKLLHSKHNVLEALDHKSEAAHYAIEAAKAMTIEDLSRQDLSTEVIGKAGSIVSAIPGVRKALLDFQHRVAQSPKGAVLDGRDIGTVVCPHADFKFFITATIETRATRRYKELQKLRNGVIYDDILEDLKQRDERDTKRSVAPLRPADDAVSIDTTDLDLDKVFETVVGIIQSSSNI